MGPGDLAEVLAGLPFSRHPDLLTSLERAEDAGVYRLSDDTALIQTVDFFTPIVDDPYAFGQIAAANALSDVYAMGGRPLTAMNIVCFPQDDMEMIVLREVLRGGLDKVHEAGTVLVGGHSVKDSELKYGLAVTGIIHPDRVVYNRGARAGDRLVLTKPLGTGILTTAIKRNEATKEAIAEVTASMGALNRRASELMMGFEVHACTDVTGFGLAGHAGEMIEGADVGMALQALALPLLSNARELAEKGMVPGGTERNRQYRQHMVEIAPEVLPVMTEIVYDPQTSGGLLIALPAPQAEKLLGLLHKEGMTGAAIIGEVTAEAAGRIRIV